MIFYLREGVDGLLVRIWIALSRLGVLVEGHIKPVVRLRDVLLQMLPWLRSAFRLRCRLPGLIVTYGLRETCRLTRQPSTASPPTSSVTRSTAVFRGDNTFPLRRRSNSVKPTTPTFLSEVDAAPPTKPVVYSPVPTWRRSSARRLVLIATPNKRCEACSWCHAKKSNPLQPPHAANAACTRRKSNENLRRLR